MVGFTITQVLNVFVIVFLNNKKKNETTEDKTD